MNWADRFIERITRRPPDFVIGGQERPYLRRWFVIPRNPIWNVYLHQFLRSDHPMTTLRTALAIQRINTMRARRAASLQWMAPGPCTCLVCTAKARGLFRLLGDVEPEPEHQAPSGAKLN